MLGIYAACYLRESGYDHVAVVDLNEARLGIAKRFGATHTFNPDKTPIADIDAALKELTNGRGADLGVEGQWCYNWDTKPDYMVGCRWTLFDARLRLPQRAYLCRCPPTRHKMYNAPRGS